MLVHLQSFLIDFIIVLIVILASKDVWKKFKFGRKYAPNTPVVPHLPFIGMAFLMILKDPLNLTAQFARKLKSSYYFWIFSTPYYVTWDPEELKIILTHRHTIEKGSAYNCMRVAIHDALLFRREPAWRKSRRLLAKCFNQQILNSFIPTFNNISDGFVEAIEHKENVSSLEKKNSKIFCDSVFHTLARCNEDQTLIEFLNKVDLHKACSLVLGLIFKRLLNPLYQYDTIYACTPNGKEYFVMEKFIEHFCDAVIESSRKRRMESDFSEEMDVSIIDVLDSGHLDRKTIVGDIKFILGAAVETSETALALVLAILGIHMDIQEKVYEEVKHLKECDDMIDIVAPKDMKYTEMVILETLRLFPPVPLILREATEDIELNGKLIPKGTNFIIQIMETNRNEKYWTDPLKFDPSRFSTQEVKNRHPFCYVPFSAGPRNCIAWKYALMSITILVAKVVRRYKISCSLKSSDDIKTESYVSLKVSNNFDITFTERSG